MSAHRYAKIGVVAAVVALATGCAAESGPLQSTEDENVSEVSQAAVAPLVILESVQAAPDSAGDPFSGINPCVKVLRGLYVVSQITSNQGVQFDFSYTSAGQPVTESATVPIDSMTFMGKDPENKRYFLLDSFIDVDSPVDPGSTIETEITLVTNLSNCS